MIFLFIIALIGFAIACPGITIFLFWLFTRPLVIGAIIIFVLISVISICVTENRHEEKSASDDVAPQEKGDWYIHYLNQPQEEQDENDVAGLHNENTSLDNPPGTYRDKKSWHIQTLSKQRAKNKKNDREANMALFSWLKYDKEGYDKNGFDREGYNRSGYDKDGYNREGFNQAGFDYYGYDKYGFDKDGYNAEGYNRLGFDVNGFSKSGFDKEGYDQAGYNRQGFDRHGYDKEGYSPTGYDANGYNRQGYTRDGFGRDGYNLEGYNRLGFDANGFNKLGFDKNGFDHDGYNAEGYNAEGYNKLGFDSDGYDKSGFDKEGYDRRGYNRQGYDHKGFNKDGYDIEGYNYLGFDSNGYGRDGFNKEGYNQAGCDRLGYNQEGYNYYGFDKNGFGRDGFDIDGRDKWGNDNGTPFLGALFGQYNAIVVFDVATTGLDLIRDQIVKISAKKLTKSNKDIVATSFTVWIQLYDGHRMSEGATRVTHITGDWLNQTGVVIDVAIDKLIRFLNVENDSKCVFVSHNAAFDIAFLAAILYRLRRLDVWEKIDVLDTLTVFKDRHPYPHKLSDAILDYKLDTILKNFCTTQDAETSTIDDVEVLTQVLFAMWREKPDLDKYINLFGYNPKYPIKNQLRKIQYEVQEYDSQVPLYLLAKKEVHKSTPKIQGDNLGLLVCPDCHGTVSKRAQVCPHCGCPIELIAKRTEKQKQGEEVSSQKAAVAETSKPICENSSLFSKEQTVNTKVHNGSDKTGGITELLGAHVLNYDDKHEAVISNISNTSVYVSGENYWNVKSIYEFLGHFKFLNPQDKSKFYQIFGQELNNYKTEKEREERTKERRNTSLLDCSDEDYYDDLIKKSGSGPDDIGEVYGYYHSYD